MIDQDFKNTNDDKNINNVTEPNLAFSSFPDLQTPFLI